MKRILVTFLVQLITGSVAIADSSVWKVQSDDSVLYLGGTCHVLREIDYPLPEEFQKAYDASVTLVFETDIKALSDPNTQQILISKGMLSDGQTLEHVLSPKVYQALSTYCDQVGLPATSLGRFKPSMVMLTLMAVEFQKIGVTQNGVDLHFFQKAVTDEKTTLGLEPVEQHINMVLTMGEGDEDGFVMHTLEDLKGAGQIIEGLIKAWRGGDENTMNKMLVEDLKKEYPTLYQSLLVDRNLDWLPKIEQYLESEDVELILVGAAHLAGQDGILESLRDRGYEVEKLH